MQYGSIFSGEAQTIKINCDPEERIEETRWKVGAWMIDYGEKWYYGRLKYTRPDFTSDEYLIHDQVNPDGWGIITIYRNVRVVSTNAPNLVPRLDEPACW